MLRFFDGHNEGNSPDPTAAEGARAILLLDQLAVPAFAVGADGRVLVWNKACERLTQVMAAEVLGTREHWHAFFSTAQACPPDFAVKSRCPDAAAPAPGSADHTVATVGAPARERWCAMPRVGRDHCLAFDAALVRDLAGQTVAVIHTVRDVTRHKRLELVCEATAPHDALTGLPIRRTFDQLAQIHWVRAEKDASPLSVLVVDIDCFKLYNDLYGLQNGDACLGRVAGVIEEQLTRAADLAARIGGGRFAVLLPATALGVAGEVAERMRQAVAGLQVPHAASVAAPFVSVSIGVASGTALDTPLEQLLADADAALMRAKREGRNRCSASRTGMPISVIDAFDDRPTTREALRRRRDLKRGG